MQTIRTTLFALLALTWVGLTSHCQIEAIPGLAAFCCESDEHGSGAGEAENRGSCEDKGCCPLESAQYHPPRHQDLAPLIIRLDADATPFDRAVMDDCRAIDLQPARLTAGPPELASTWRFRFRAALPPRAPSLAS